MAVATTSTFNLEIAEIIDEAFDRLGGEPLTGYDPITARRSLNLLLNDWINRGINLWTLELKTQTVTAGDIDYTLDSDTVDILDAVLRRDGIDYPMTRLSLTEYNNIPDKDLSGLPTQWYLDRQRDAPILYIWLASENSTDVVRYWRIRYFKDVNQSAVQNADTPRRFLPALASGLAYYLCMKRAGATAEEEQ